MRCDVVARWQDADETLLAGRRVVVIDVLRATTTIAAALAAGAAGVWPVAQVDEAFALAERLRREGRQVLLAGERQNHKVPGFDLGNSPQVLTPQLLAGADLVLTTTNGTPGLAKAKEHGAAEVYAGALINGPAVTAALAAQPDGPDITLVCAGTKGYLALEDFFCAGLIVDGLTARWPDMAVNDTARAARLAFAAAVGCWPEPLVNCSHAQSLARAGFTDDIDYCARIGSNRVVPLMMGERLVPAG